MLAPSYGLAKILGGSIGKNTQAELGQRCHCRNAAESPGQPAFPRQTAGETREDPRHLQRAEYSTEYWSAPLCEETTRSHGKNKVVRGNSAQNSAQSHQQNWTSRGLTEHQAEHTDGAGFVAADR